jgi:protein-disulfide isomerase
MTRWFSKANIVIACSQLSYWRVSLLSGSCIGFFTILSLLIVRGAMGQCSSTTPIDEKALIQYVGERFHVAPTEISITKNEPVDASCYRQLRFEASNPKRQLTLFLTPDHRYLVPSLYDLEVDPLRAEAQERHRITELLQTGSAPRRGPDSAPVTIVEFADFQCPFCKRFKEVLARWNSQNPEDLQTRVIFLNLPLPIHSWAETAARVGICLQQVSGSDFWEFHDYVFDNQGSITLSSLIDKGEGLIRRDDLGTKVDLKTCVGASSTTALLTKDRELAQQLGVNATPTLFINGRRFEGALVDSQLASILDKERTASQSIGDGPQ